MDLRTWIVEEHRSLWPRFDDGIASLVPRHRWAEHPDNGGSCIAQLLTHISLHADYALQCVIREQAPLAAEWRDRLGLGRLAPHHGVAESEDPAVVAAVDPEALYAYAWAVHDTTATWLATADLAVLDGVPPASERLERLAGVTVDAVPWLHRMWADKPGAWFVQWEACGHILNHIGEMVSVRNRMGLSPF